MNSRYHFFFLCEKGMQLTAILASQAVPSVNWIGGRQSPYPMSILVLEFVSVLLYRKHLPALTWSFKSKKGNPHSSFGGVYIRTYRFCFTYICCLRTWFDSLTTLYPICHIPRHDLYYCLTFSVMYSDKRVQFILTSKVNLALLILEIPLSYP